MMARSLWNITLFGLCCMQIYAAGLHLLNMESFITALKDLEELNPTHTPLDLVRALRKITSKPESITHNILKSPQNHSGFIGEQLNINHNLSSFLNQTLHHFITDRHEERGVVLTPDGTTVALAPLLLGLESGLRAFERKDQPHGFYLQPLAKTLGLCFLQFHNATQTGGVGADGCWDSVSSPKVFSLSGVPSLVTDAMVHGGMDAAILGRHISSRNFSNVNISTLLSSYYVRSVEELDHILDAHTKGCYRRKNFKQITNATVFQEKVADVLKSQGNKSLESGLEMGLRQFVLRYMECPAIIPRCIWGAAPPHVPLSSLSPPLQFLYIHHTFIPSKPCRSLQMCSKNMRAMQHFHQKDRGWHDIGYSFVVGSDGYIYEGRGWMSQGAHTKGRNSVGYGVAYIGDYTNHLPSTHDMELVHHHLVKCGVNSGFLQENYTILGHRQVVATDCPGDALYSEITTWKHYKDKDPLK